MARIAVVSSDPIYVAQLRALSEAVEAQIINAGATGGIDSTTAMGVMAQRPDTVVLGPGLDLSYRVQLSEELDALYPQVVVIWAVEDDTDVLATAMRAGARDLLLSNAPEAVVIEKLRLAIGIGDRRQHRPFDPDVLDESEKRGRIITVVSPKGGSGKTMLSTNLAIGLHQQSRGDVVLVDLDLQFGDTSSALGLRAEYSLVDVVKSAGDATAMKAFLTPHPSGIFLLAAPNNPVEAEEIATDQLSKLLDSLSTEFGHVVVDTAAGIDEATLVAVEQSSDVVFITTIDVAAIQALRKAVVVLDRLKLDQHDRWLILNRASSRTGLSRGEIEEVTGLVIDAEIPSHRSVSKSMNDGRPLLDEQARGRVGKSLTTVTRLFQPKGTKTKKWGQA